MKIDSQRRLQIPINLLRDVKIFSENEVRVSVCKQYIQIFKMDDIRIKGKEYHDILRIDKKGRITISKRLMEYYNPEEQNFDYIVAALDGTIIIRWRTNGQEGE